MDIIQLIKSDESCEDVNDKRYWYNKDKFVILGFSRCGTTTLSRFMHCSHPEIGYSGTEEYLKNYSQCRPVFLTRHPIDRIWSMYNYHRYFQNYTFEGFLDFKSDLWHNVGCNDCIEQSNYSKYIEPFTQYDPITIKLEDIQKLPSYPKDWRGTSSKEMPDEYRRIVEDRLKDVGINY
jgi:hypothetical protein